MAKQKNTSKAVKEIAKKLDKAETADIKGKSDTEKIKNNLEDIPGFNFYKK